MIARLLVANRGEIACRIIRTARRMGIATVAVYSDADAGALHADLADAHAHIGPSDARASYLNMDAIVAVAKEQGADAIHPGYGFLSESASFAARCEREGIVFVGPSAKAIESAGSKIEAKRIAQAADLPVIDGFAIGPEDSSGAVAKRAGKIGYPLLVKASSGGGGRGIRLVESEHGLAEAVAQAARESKAGFGAPGVFIEKALLGARHVEVQVLVDSAGEVAVVGDRDCSLQRRRQKVIEEAPARSLSEKRRMAVHADASRFAAEIGYRNAGTVEFLVDADGAHYFLEMNARLQVEHPVTEMVYGVDLVELQLRIAAGERLSGTFPPPPQGHAVEMRICSEIPEQGFAPARGTFVRIDAPDAADAQARVRFDSGVAAGDCASEHYDSLVAKLVVHHRDGREACLEALCRALGDLRVEGVATNLAYLQEASTLTAFVEGTHTVDLLAQEADAIVARCLKTAGEATGLAVACWLHGPHAGGTLAGFRLNSQSRTLVAVSDEMQTARLLAEQTAPDSLRVGHVSGGELLELSGIRVREDRLVARLGGRSVDVRFWIEGDPVVWRVGVRHGGIWRDFALRSVLDGRNPMAGGDLADARHVFAPMHGRLVAVKVKAGGEVLQNQTVALLEAMKIEMPVKAPASGTVAEIVRQEGDQVSMGDLLVRLDA